MSTPDMGRIDALVAWAEAEEHKAQAGERSEWHQGQWATWSACCGTACCIAGKTVLEDGGKFVSEDEGDVVTGAAEIPGGHLVTISTYAQQVLGLSRRDAQRLFAPSNDLETLKAYAKDLANFGKIRDETFHTYTDDGDGSETYVGPPYGGEGFA